MASVLKMAQMPLLSKWTLLDIRRAKGQQVTDGLDEKSGLHCAVNPTRSEKKEKKISLLMCSSFKVNHHPLEYVTYTVVAEN